jgi:mannan endo-1,4-beta-mannosidase
MAKHMPLKECLLSIVVASMAVNLSACTPIARQGAMPVAAEIRPIDAKATAETRNLFFNMKQLASRGVMFGHQNTLAYGYSWRDAGETAPIRSDIHDVVGDYPAVYGWDLMDVVGKSRPGEISGIGTDRMRHYVQSAHARGGINTFSWHMGNPVTQTDSWDKTHALEHIIPGGRLHSNYVMQLDEVAAFFNSLKDKDGQPIPIWFRPFHEHTGNWFWWGKGNTTAAEYKILWKFTVDYLQAKGVHNVLYAYSTDVFDSEKTYFEFYPGDDYVDMLGFDDYHSVKSTATANVLQNRLAMVSRWASERGKLAALTETGVEAIPQSTWWTDVLLPALSDNPQTKGISYVLVWRNANPAFDRKEHFHAPYKGQKSAADFVIFYNHPQILFERDLPNMYALPK